MVTTAEKVMNIMVKHWIIYGTIAETENKSDFENILAERKIPAASIFEYYLVK